MTLVIDPSQKSLSCDSYILSQYYLWRPVCPLCFPTHTGNLRISFIFYYLDWPVHQLPYLLCLDFYWFAKQLPLTSPSTHLLSHYLKSIYCTKTLSPFSPMPWLSSWFPFSCLVFFWFLFLFVLGFSEDVSQGWFGSCYGL